MLLFKHRLGWRCCYDVAALPLLVDIAGPAHGSPLAVRHHLFLEVILLMIYPS